MSRRAFYVYVPTLKSRSAGIRVLLKLCRMLIELGFDANVAVPSGRWKEAISEGVELPLLTPTKIIADFDAGAAPIVVYPEVVIGNPMNASVVARYVLNWPGKLGGPRTFDPGERIYCYTKTLSEAIGDFSVLNLQVVDSSVYFDRRTPVRSGSCFYAAKYRRLGGVPRGLPDDCIEIRPEEQNGQSPQEIAELLSKSAVLYVFEDTLLSLEAALTGCPNVFVPNEFFAAPFGDGEFGIVTPRIDAENCQELARANVAVIRQAYGDLIAQERASVSRFASELQDVAPSRQGGRMNLVIPKSNGEFSVKGLLDMVGSVLSAFPGGKALRILKDEARRMKLRVRSDPHRRWRVTIRGIYST